MPLSRPRAPGVGSPVAGDRGQPPSRRAAAPHPDHALGSHRAGRDSSTAPGSETLTAKAGDAFPCGRCSAPLRRGPERLNPRGSPPGEGRHRTRGGWKPAKGDREGQGRGKSIRRAWGGRAVRRAPLSSDPPGRGAFTPARERTPSACMAGTSGLRIARRRPPGIAPLETPGGRGSGSEAGDARNDLQNSQGPIGNPPEARPLKGRASAGGCLLSSEALICLRYIKQIIRSAPHRAPSLLLPPDPIPSLEDPQRLEDLPVHLSSFRLKGFRHPLVDLNEVQQQLRRGSELPGGIHHHQRHAHQHEHQMKEARIHHPQPAHAAVRGHHQRPEKPPTPQKDQTLQTLPDPIPTPKIIVLIEGRITHRIGRPPQNTQLTLDLAAAGSAGIQRGRALRRRLRGRTDDLQHRIERIPIMPTRRPNRPNPTLLHPSPQATLRHPQKPGRLMRLQKKLGALLQARPQIHGRRDQYRISDRWL